MKVILDFDPGEYITAHTPIGTTLPIEKGQKVTIPMYVAEVLPAATLGDVKWEEVILRPIAEADTDDGLGRVTIEVATSE